MPAEVFERKTAQLFETIKNSPCAEGCDEIYIPGEIEWRRMDEAREKGISLPAAVVDELQALAEKYQVPFDCERD
jgi:LDH2 family malate/lactate/ureidoglycolate dehydrogenase